MRTKWEFDRAMARLRPQARLSRRLAPCLMALLCALTVALPAFAGKKKVKVPRAVMGVVLDGAENPIVGAVVEMTDVQTGKKSALYTQDGGRYEFSGLDQDHDYKVQASYKGVASESRMASSYDTRNTIRLNLRIPPPKEEKE